MIYYIAKRYIRDSVLKVVEELHATSEESAIEEFNTILKPLIDDFIWKRFAVYREEFSLDNNMNEYSIRRVTLGNIEYCLTSNQLLSMIQLNT